MPTLFDHYQSFTPRPASYFGLPVYAVPRREIATVHGGGLVASGPAGNDRLPTPWAPPGLRLTGLEGAGEVQTPLTGTGGRPARGSATSSGSGTPSPASRSSTPVSVHLLAGDRLVAQAPTYRGLGLAF